MDMLLANGIILPLALAWGFVTLGPLTVVVAAVEALVLRSCLKSAYRPVFVGVLSANVVSLLAGVIIMPLPSLLLHASGGFDSIPRFVESYRWVGPLVVLVFFAKSVLIETWWLRGKKFLERIGSPPRAIWRPVLLANALSYIFIGPLYYWATRPHYAGLEMTHDARWTTNPDVTVYYLDPKTRHVMAMTTSDVTPRTVAPRAAEDFMVNADESLVAYSDDDGLHVYDRRRDESLLLWPASLFTMKQVSLSTDGRYVRPRTGRGHGPRRPRVVGGRTRIARRHERGGRRRGVPHVQSGSAVRPALMQHDGAAARIAGGKLHALGDAALLERRGGIGAALPSLVRVGSANDARGVGIDREERLRASELLPHDERSGLVAEWRRGAGRLVQDDACAEPSA